MADDLRRGGFQTRPYRVPDPPVRLAVKKAAAKEGRTLDAAELLMLTVQEIERLSLVIAWADAAKGQSA